LSRLLEKNPYLIGGSLGAVLLVFAMINDSILHVKMPMEFALVRGSCWRDILGWQGHDSQREESATDSVCTQRIEAALVDVSKVHSLSSRHMETARVEQRGPIAPFFVHVQYKAQLLSGGYIGHCGTLCSLRLARQMLNQSASLFWLLELKFQVQVTCVASETFDFEIMAMISGRDRQLEPKVQILLPKVFPDHDMGSVEGDQALSKPRREGKMERRVSLASRQDTKSLCPVVRIGIN
jgi:hypothetical protein